MLQRPWFCLRHRFPPSGVSERRALDGNHRGYVHGSPIYLLPRSFPDCPGSHIHLPILSTGSEMKAVNPKLTGPSKILIFASKSCASPEPRTSVSINGPSPTDILKSNTYNSFLIFLPLFTNAHARASLTLLLRTHQTHPAFSILTDHALCGGPDHHHALPGHL